MNVEDITEEQREERNERAFNAGHKAAVEILQECRSPNEIGVASCIQIALSHKLMAHATNPSKDMSVLNELAADHAERWISDVLLPNIRKIIEDLDYDEEEEEARH